MSIWKNLAKICSMTPWTKKWSLYIYQQYKNIYYRKKYKNKEILHEKMVVFEAFMGKKYACSPKALYEAMVADPAYDSWEKVWVFREPEKYSFLAPNKNTKVVSYGKGAYYKAYAQAKYWITNSRLPKELQPAKEQVYIQCWHGTPLKKLGFDLEHYAEKNSSLQEVRNNYLDEGKRVTHMPSPSPFYTEKITSAFHLKELGKESVLQEMGYPRNDALFTTSTEEIRRIKDRLGIPADKKIILYAPTWRETEHIPGEGYQYDLKVDFEKWKERLGERYVVLFRAHYFISNAFDFSSYEGFVYNVSDVDDINQLYLVSDLLITDYSSVFFDYANLERPLVFYMYDYEVYKYKMRDFYFNVEELPGPIVKEEERLLEMIKNIEDVNVLYTEKYNHFNQKFNPHKKACSEEYLKQWFMD